MPKTVAPTRDNITAPEAAFTDAAELLLVLAGGEVDALLVVPAEAGDVAVLVGALPVDFADEGEVEVEEPVLEAEVEPEDVISSSDV